MLLRPKPFRVLTICLLALIPVLAYAWETRATSTSTKSQRRKRRAGVPFERSTRAGVLG
jgi:hypothetical protein